MISSLALLGWSFSELFDVYLNVYHCTVVLHVFATVRFDINLNVHQCTVVLHVVLHVLLLYYLNYTVITPYFTPVVFALVLVCNTPCSSLCMCSSTAFIIV